LTEDDTMKIRISKKAKVGAVKAVGRVAREAAMEAVDAVLDATHPLSEDGRKITPAEWSLVANRIGEAVREAVQAELQTHRNTPSAAPVG
jgi:hypothetical protein